MHNFRDRQIARQARQINADFHERYARSWDRHDAALSSAAMAEQRLLADAGAAVRDRQVSIQSGIDLARRAGFPTWAKDHAGDATVDAALSSYAPPPVEVPPPGVALSQIFDLPADAISPDRVELSDSDRQTQTQTGDDLVRHLPGTFGKPA